ncbi:MAG: lipoyl(octanoyl) transferase LipB [Pseudomonadota bacterium]|nr:lipoyl(octanoyl) transferase LipB [Pseudomonadota bacterium]
MPDDLAHAGPATLVRALGTTDYEVTWGAMQAFTAARDAHSPDEVWLTEHRAVYTLGLAGRMQHVLRDNGIAVRKVDRGGQVTYHGPGQLIVYLMIDLKRRALGVRSMVRALEGGVIDWLSGFGVAAHARERAPGVYVRDDRGECKIAALGLRVRNGCTYHGLSVNLSMDLAPFDDIDPCGYPGLRVTQLSAFAHAPSVESAGKSLTPRLLEHIARVHR